MGQSILMEDTNSRRRADEQWEAMEKAARRTNWARSVERDKMYRG